MKDNKRFLTILMLLLMVTLVAVGKTVTLSTAAKTNKFTLVIDAGHGGNDAGAIGSLTKEKIINLNVALAFGKLVERNCSDVKVIYTRKTDVFIPLHTRADIANRNKADLFISIHTNALPKGHISRGLETYTLGMHRAADNLEVAKRENEVILYEKDYKQRYQGFDPNSSESYIMFEFIQDHNMAQSVEMAKYVQRRTCASAGRLDKGVKQAGFLVLRETSMPSCLIELGFISTPDEERFLNTTSGVNQLAQGIYQAFLDYKRKYYGGVTVPLKAESKAEVEIPTVVPKAEPKAEVKPEPKPEVKAEVKPEPKPEVKAEVKPEPKPEAKPDSASSSTSPTSPTSSTSPTSLSSPTTPAIAAAPAVPVFKVQILASSTKLKSNDPRLKGQKDAACYEEGGLYKYTVGSSANYNEIAKLRKTLAADFPQCFIIAFKDGAKVNVQLAIQEFRNNNKK
jgi:N-acetylmuramoyl-L-alanine amidase